MGATLDSAKKMRQNQLVEVQISGEPTSAWYEGKVIKAKKMWVEIKDFYGDTFIADENNITAWRFRLKVRA